MTEANTANAKPPRKRRKRPKGAAELPATLFDVGNEPMSKTIAPESEDHWLALRRDVITSTQVAALFGASPYNTAFDLYHHHANGVELPFEMNDRIATGNAMEEFAARQCCAEYDWAGAPFKDFIMRPHQRIGSSFDWRLMCDKRGKGLLEVKGVDWMVYRDQWRENEAPPHIEFQVQTQLLVSGLKWACVTAWTGIYEHHEVFYEADPAMHALILRAVAAHWARVDAKREPPIDPERDWSMLSMLHPVDDGAEIDLTGEDNIDEIAAEMLDAAEARKAAAKRESAAKTLLLARLGDAKAGYTKAHRISAPTVTKKGKEITADMVGTITGASQFRKLTVKETSQ